LDLLTQWRLSDIQSMGSPAKMEFFSNSHEIPEMTQLERRRGNHI
jgi:hypothetical protein